MEAVFHKLIGNGFSDVAGLTANASIPISQSLANDVIEAALQGNKAIESCQVSIHKENRVFVRLKTAAFPWPLNIKLKLDEAVDFASFSSPKLRAWLENNQLLGSLGSFLHAFPEWIKLYGNQVVVDLGFFLSTPEQKRLLDLVKSIDLRTAEGKAILDVKIGVE